MARCTSISLIQMIRIRSRRHPMSSLPARMIWPKISKGNRGSDSNSYPAMPQRRSCLPRTSVITSSNVPCLLRHRLCASPERTNTKACHLLLSPTGKYGSCRCRSAFCRESEPHAHGLGFKRGMCQAMGPVQRIFSGLDTVHEHVDNLLSHFFGTPSRHSSICVCMLFRSGGCRLWLDWNLERSMYGTSSVSALNGKVFCPPLDKPLTASPLDRCTAKIKVSHSQGRESHTTIDGVLSYLANGLGR